ncbi:MAG: hypothetical protein ACAF41_18165 [Leptolyngbya sp. BL-A-14]
MDTGFDRQNNTFYIGKFIFSKQVPQLDFSKSKKIFPYEEEHLLCEFYSYSIPAVIPDWLAVENQVVNDYICTILWSHPELKELWRNYFCTTYNTEEYVELNDINLSTFDFLKPDLWFLELLQFLGFIVIDELRWGAPQFNCYGLPDEIPNWIQIRDSVIKAKYFCIVYWEHPDLQKRWEDYLDGWVSLLSEDDLNTYKHTDLFDPETWLANLLAQLEFDVELDIKGLEKFDWRFLPDYFSQTFS